MNLKCMLVGHEWRFSYNHGMPFGITTEVALEMFEKDETYPVFECTRCGKQARLVDAKMVVLPSADIEVP